jgi:hypothetical protein
MTAPVASAWDIREVRLVEASLVAAPAFGPDAVVCSAYDQTVCADVGAFYRADKNRLTRVGIVAALGATWGLRLRLTEGASSPKASLQPSLQVGLIRSHALGAGRSLTLEAYTSVGGAVIHRPCIDAYERQYHCGTLTSWEDFPSKRLPAKDFGFRAALRF